MYNLPFFINFKNVRTITFKILINYLMLKTNSLGLCQRLNMEKVLAENVKRLCKE